LNTLTRVLFWGEDERAAQRAFARVYVEQAILAGDAGGAIAAIALLHRTQKFWTLPGTSTNPGVAALVHLQERFIFSHEYCHLLMAASTAFMESRTRTADMLLEPIDELHSRAIYDRYLERYGASLGEIEFTQAAKAQEDFVADHRTVVRAELACDDFALHAAIMGCVKLRLDPLLAFEAAFLALRNIRVLSYIRGAADPRNRQADSLGGLQTRLLQVRQHRLRAAFPLVAEAHHLADRLAKLGPRLMELSDLHDQRIDEPLLFSTLGRIRKARKKTRMNSRSGRDITVAIAEAEGWAPRSPVVQFVTL
jgi:hypothetical protein